MSNRLEHFYESVPGWASFTSLYAQQVARAPSDRSCIFVEVGSWLGRSAAFMGVEIINSGKKIHLHCVDPWKDGGPDLRNTNYFKDLKESPYDIFLRNVHPVIDVITPHRTPSVDAAKRFEDGSIDFLMIDGDHGYEAVRDDLEAWLPKMRAGGVISGDDFLWPGVEKAVAERFGLNGAFTKIRKHHENYRNSVSYWWKQL